MNKKILVPLDGSKRAEKILPYVEDLAPLRLLPVGVNAPILISTVQLCM